MISDWTYFAAFLEYKHLYETSPKDMNEIMPPKSNRKQPVEEEEKRNER